MYRQLSYLNFNINLHPVKFYTIIGPIRALLITLALSSCFAYNFLLVGFNWNKLYLPPSTIFSLVSYFVSFVGTSKGLLWLQCYWQLSKSKLINKKMIMLQRTLHDSFKVFCEHYLINHRNSPGEDKHGWLSYLDHIFEGTFFCYCLIMLWNLDSNFSYWLFGYNLICWCKMSLDQ